MKIGLIVVGRNMEEYFGACLAPWLRARGGRLLDHEFMIAGVCVPFMGFPEQEDDGTGERFEELYRKGDIDLILHQNGAMPETEARGRALNNLVAHHCDLVIQVDLDELWTYKEIERVLRFVEGEPLVAWFKVCYKNLVFTEDQWLKDPFTPARIFRTKVGGYKAHSFYADNNILYGGTITRDLKRDEDFSHLTIPMHVAHVKHLTWLQDNRSKLKVEYQTARGWQCSFAWDEAKGLIFNPVFRAPEVVRA